MEELIREARALAEERHRGQTDKSGAPYIDHPRRVAEGCTSPRAKIAAWLHDTVEDTGLSLQEIADRFGPETAHTVDCLTHRPWESYMDYVRRAGSDPVAREVKIRDLIDNSNLGRLKRVTLQDVQRQAKYNRALQYLLETGEQETT